ncbi:hypothetical protein ACEQPO_17295 [Bacillus sp. SL00103]
MKTRSPLADTSIVNGMRKRCLKLVNTCFLSKLEDHTAKHERRIFFDELENFAKSSYDALPIKNLQDLAVSIKKDLMAFRQKTSGKWIASESLIW